jgi:hypothetical protein
LPVRRIVEEQADECIAEDDGDLANGLIERGIAFAYERSPCPRSPKASCAVQNDHPRRSPLRGRTGVWWMGSTRRSAASVNYVRRMSAICLAWTATSAVTMARAGST